MTDIIQTMLEQHKVLLRTSSNIISLSKNTDRNSKEIYGELLKFRVGLDDHLTLENDVFYPRLIKAMIKKKLEVKNTILFIEKVKNIENAVYLFLKKYKIVGDINNPSNNFYDDFSDVAGSLSVRVMSEEDGVYVYWELYNLSE